MKKPARGGLRATVIELPVTKLSAPEFVDLKVSYSSTCAERMEPLTQKSTGDNAGQVREEINHGQAYGTY